MKGFMKLSAFYLLMRVIVVVLVLGSLLTTAYVPETVLFAQRLSITGTDGFPEDVGISHFGLFYPFAGRNVVGFWSRPHLDFFLWEEMEPRPGQYVWAKFDQLIGELQRKRAAILPTVFPFAQWDQELCHSDGLRMDPGFPRLGALRYAPCDMRAYEVWLGKLVERYDGDGVDDMPGLSYPVRHWEILNEPDTALNYELQGTKDSFFAGDANAYLEILRVSYNAIKQADPQAVVIVAATILQDPSHRGYALEIYRGGKGYFDLGNHHYLGSSTTLLTEEYRDLLQQTGYGQLAFWLTEANPVPDRELRQGSLSSDELRRRLFVAFSSAFGNGAEVIFCTDACDPGLHGPSDGPSGRSPQGLQDAFLFLAEHIGQFSSAERLAPNAVRFHMPDGAKIYALWDNAVLLSWEFGGTAKVITYLGEESEQEVSQIFASVPILAVVE